MPLFLSCGSGLVCSTLPHKRCVCRSKSGRCGIVLLNGIRLREKVRGSLCRHLLSSWRRRRRPTEVDAEKIAKPACFPLQCELNVAKGQSMNGLHAQQNREKKAAADVDLILTNRMCVLRSRISRCKMTVRCSRILFLVTFASMNGASSSS